MKNIDNIISEELKKMTSLFHYQAGKVISEQTNTTEESFEPIYRKIVAAAELAGTNEDDLVNAINSISTIDDYNKINGALSKRFGAGYKSLESLLNGELDTQDLSYAKSISQKLKSLGVNNTYKTTPRGGFYPKSFVMTSEPIIKTGAPVDATQRIKNITSAFCRVQNGVIVWPGSTINNMKWVDYTTKYKPTTQELTTAQSSCPKSKDTNTNQIQQRRAARQKALVTATQQIQTSIGSKPTGQLTDAELTTILNRL